MTALDTAVPRRAKTGYNWFCSDEQEAEASVCIGGGEERRDSGSGHIYSDVIFVTSSPAVFKLFNARDPQV